jgi:hypothetical protein
MEQPGTSNDKGGPAPGAVLTYLKKMVSGVTASAFRGAQVAIFAAAALMAGGITFALIGKPAYLVSRWLWSILWNF